MLPQSSLFPALKSVDDVEIRLFRTVIVEPEVSQQQLLSSLAAGRGHDVAAFSTPLEAAEDLLTTHTDLFVLRLNHQTAAQALQLLQFTLPKLSYPRCYVLAITDAEESTAHLEAWLRCGIDDITTHHQSGPQTTEKDLEVLGNRLAICEHLVKRSKPIAAPSGAPKSVPLPADSLFQALPLAALVLAKSDLKILHANAAAADILGKSVADLAPKFLSLALPELFDHVDFRPEALALEKMLRIRPFKLQRLDQNPISLAAQLHSFTWPQADCMLVLLSDAATGSTQFQSTLQKARHDASINTLKGMARELSDALTSIHGNLELLTRQPFPSPESRELVDAAQFGVKKIETYTRRASALARLQEPQDLKKQPLALQPLIEKAVAFALLDGKSVPSVDIPGPLWTIAGQPALLTDAVLQIVRNADRAMPPGSQLRVKAYNTAMDQHEELGASVVIEITDEGHGLSPEELGKVQDPFYSTWGREGMGLATAGAAIRAHGGHLQIRSEENKGTTVTIHLPADTNLIQTPALPAEPAKEAPCRVLFMDDDPQIRSLIQKILSSTGYSIYCTNDGAEAVEAYRKAHQFGSPFEVILMDLDVRGGMGGIEATQILRKEFPNLKAILTTGYVDETLLETHREMGFLGVLLKPFEVERLISIINRLAKA